MCYLPRLGLGPLNWSSGFRLGLWRLSLWFGASRVRCSSTSKKALIVGGLGKFRSLGFRATGVGRQSEVAPVVRTERREHCCTVHDGHDGGRKYQANETISDHCPKP